MLVRLLNTLEFRSNNERHRPVLNALAIVRQYADSRLRVYPLEDDIPVDGIVRGPWLETVLERDESGIDNRAREIAPSLHGNLKKDSLSSGRGRPDTLQGPVSVLIGVSIGEPAL